MKPQDIVIEELHKACDGMEMARSDLRVALAKSGAVQGLALLPLIGRAEELRRDVYALLGAVEQDKPAK